jgi:cytochrome c-type biogenesis protein CcmH
VIGIGCTRRAGRLRTVAFGMLLAALCATGAGAAGPEPTDKDPVKEARAVRLASELRCLVCQNQTIADSNADLAVDLRRQVREQIAAGRSDTQIIDYMTERYGDFVLYRPPFKASTALLWGGPLLLLVIGAMVAIQVARRRSAAAGPAISTEERERARALLAGRSTGERG